MTFFGNSLFTPRLQLRRIEEDDLGLIVDWSNSQEAHGDYLTPERLTMEQAREQLRCGMYWDEQKRTFLIELRDGPPIGTIHFWLRSETPDTAVMALKIAVPDRRAEGYGSEAQKYLIMFLFDRLGLQYVEMYTDIDNKAQQHCLKKLGFDLVCSLAYEDQHVKRTGHLYRLTRKRYLAELLYKFHYA